MKWIRLVLHMYYFQDNVKEETIDEQEVRFDFTEIIDEYYLIHILKFNFTKYFFQSTQNTFEESIKFLLLKDTATQRQKGEGGYRRHWRHL